MPKLLYPLATFVIIIIIIIIIFLYFDTRLIHVELLYRSRKVGLKRITRNTVSSQVEKDDCGKTIITQRMIQLFIYEPFVAIDFDNRM